MGDLADRPGPQVTVLLGADLTAAKAMMRPVDQLAIEAGLDAAVQELPLRVASGLGAGL